MKAGEKSFLFMAGILVIVMASLSGGCGFLGAEDDDASPGTIASIDGSVDKRIYKDALRIVDNLQETAYQSVAEVKESAGIYKFDTAGLVGYVLERAAQKNYTKITAGLDGAIIPEHYYYYFTGLNALTKAPEGGWCRITTLANARPGDILAIKHKQGQGGGTDHVLIIVDTPVPESNGEYSVSVVDSAAAGHHGDTREADGVGKGTMYFTVDQGGSPMYYRWDDPGGEMIRRNLVGIAIGRAG